MPQVPYWETSDGCLFKAQKEHDEHESKLADIATVSRYLDERPEQPWTNAAQRTKAFNAIMAFLDWKNRDSNVVPIAKAE